MHHAAFIVRLTFNGSWQARPLFLEKKIFPFSSYLGPTYRRTDLKCTSHSTALGKPTFHTRGCHIVRVTQQIDGASPETISSLIVFLHSVPLRVKVLLWSGIPCTGGSPIQNANVHRPDHARRLAAHYKFCATQWCSWLRVTAALSGRPTCLGS